VNIFKPVSAMVAGITTGFLLVMLGGIVPMACTPAERQVVVTETQAFGPTVCVALEAVAGADVPGIAEYCTLAEDAVVAILDSLGLPSDDAGPAAINTAAKIAGTTAYRTAEMRLAARRSMMHLPGRR
jgi:hypothetical protein